MTEIIEQDFFESDDVRVLEALLFAAKAPMRVADLLPHFAGKDETYIAALLKRLHADYEGRGIVLETSEAGFAFRTAPDVGASLNIQREEVRKLSRAAMETLAIIAYHQPITRAEVETIRGVTLGKGTLDVLMELEWVKPGRRRQVPGRPLTYVTTSQFLDHFGLESITDLPAMDDLKAAGLLDRRQATSIMADLFDDEGEALPPEQPELEEAANA